MDYTQPFRITVALKHPGNLTRKVKPHSILLPSTPRTLRELIELTVQVCVRSYELRRQQGHSTVPLTEEEWSAMEEVGKFAFGVHEPATPVDEARAVATALSAVEDGLVRIFRGTEELTELSAPLLLEQDQVLTFVRLTMLSGRMW